MPMFDLWYYGRRIGATDAPTIYDERGHEHRALIRRLHHSAPDHEPPRWCGCPRRLLRARRPLWGSTILTARWPRAAPLAAAQAQPVQSVRLLRAQPPGRPLRAWRAARAPLRRSGPLSHCAPPTKPWYPNFGPLHRVRLRVSEVTPSMSGEVLGVLSRAGGSVPALVATGRIATTAAAAYYNAASGRPVNGVSPRINITRPSGDCDPIWPRAINSACSRKVACTRVL